MFCRYRHRITCFLRRFLARMSCGNFTLMLLCQSVRTFIPTSFPMPALASAHFYLRFQRMISTEHPTSDSHKNSIKCRSQSLKIVLLNFSQMAIHDAHDNCKCKRIFTGSIPCLLQPGIPMLITGQESEVIVLTPNRIDSATDIESGSRIVNNGIDSTHIPKNYKNTVSVTNDAILRKFNKNNVIIKS